MSKNFTYKKDGKVAVFFFVGSSERFCKKGKKLSLVLKHFAKSVISFSSSEIFLQKREKLSVVVKHFEKRGKGATKKTEAGELPSFVL